LKWALLSAFLVPVAICQILVTVAGFMRGQIDSGIPAPLFFAFCGLQLLVVEYLVYLARGARLDGVFLAIFCVTYSLFGVFLATMSFQDTFI
jgi:hypothetical protein